MKSKMFVIFVVSDIENPQKLSDFAQYCNDPEMQKSGDKFI